MTMEGVIIYNFQPATFKAVKVAPGVPQKNTDPTVNSEWEKYKGRPGSGFDPEY